MGKRIGNQEPTIHFALPYDITDGQDAIDLYELTGQTVYEWQRTLVKDILAKNENGLWVHTRFGYSVPRQNGKGEILAITELYGLAIGEKILHTAHLTATSHKAWERLCGLLDKLGVEYNSIKAKGQEIIEMENGGRVEFRTRTAKGGLGESYDLLIIDEAQEYQNDHKTALQYVISASKNPHTIMCGTPPTPVSSGAVFKEYRADVLSGQTQDAGWAEWSIPERSDPKETDLWYNANPSLGLRLSERTISAEIGKEEDEIIDFNIQRLGLWIRTSLQSAIQKKEWEQTKVDVLPGLTGKMHVGIKYAKSGETVSMAIAVKTGDGRIFFEVIDNRFVKDGNEWIMDFLRRTRNSVNKIIVDGKSGQQIIEDELKKEKIKGFLKPSVEQIIKANATFETKLYDRTICRMEQPSLTAVVTNCEKRPIGSNGGFGYQSQRLASDISLMDAAILAIWSASEFREPRIQRMY